MWSEEEYIKYKYMITGPFRI